MKKISLSLGAAMIFVTLANIFPAAADGIMPKTVVELFTSQGCSSCPPADRLLGEYSKNEDILALSWHVDYWNYLGWKDTFSKAQFSDRQRRYAKSMRERQIYTPQAIINGQAHVVGSHKRNLDGMISDHAEAGKNLKVAVEVTVTGEQMRIRVNEKSAIDNHPTLYMIYFDRQKSVKILRGENRGKTITYHNVVGDSQMLGMLKDGAISVDLPLPEVRRAGYDSCAIVLQETTASGSPGAIIGATVVGNLGS